MAVITMRQMLEAGAHFGHQTRRWNPKMKRFIFGERNGIYIIDLEQTLGRVETAYGYVRDLVAGGGTILFVGTKKQAQDPVRSYAEKCGMPYVNERWLGGMLTNFETMSKRVGKMLEYERMQASGEFDAMIKKEALLLDRELTKLQRNLGGLRGMTKAPGRDLRARHEEGAHRGDRGEQARYPGGRRRRHQRRSRSRAVPDPWQRRRHPLEQPVRPRDRRRRRGGSIHRQQAQPGPAAARRAHARGDRRVRGGPDRGPRRRRTGPGRSRRPPGRCQGAVGRGHGDRRHRDRRSRGCRHRGAVAPESAAAEASVVTDAPVAADEPVAADAPAEAVAEVADEASTENTEA